MDFLDELQCIESDEELIELVKASINKLEVISKFRNRTDLFGFKVSFNPEDYHILDKNTEMYVNVGLRCVYDGYIPRGTKVCYGLSSNGIGMIKNNGMYYIIDDDSYIYDFCRYIKDKNIMYEEDLFEYILHFAKKYFGTINNRNREDMFQMILKNEKVYHDPIKEHKLSDFKGKGNAMCSEYSIMANNILNIFGIESCALIGQIKRENEDSEGHAFNIIRFYSRDGEKISALIDFASSVTVFDMDYNVLGDSPFVIYLDNAEDAIDGIINDDQAITSEEYDYMVVGSSMVQLFKKSTREYTGCSKLIMKKMSNVKQK